MSAELLRRAADQMRERAKAVTPGPWTVENTGSHMHDSWAVADVERYQSYTNSVACGEDKPLADHIASWHPAVAVAVAEWLDATADNADAIGYDGPGQAGSPHAVALAVARAYLGGDSR